MCAAHQKALVSAEELTSPGAPGLASLVLTQPGSTATEMTSGNPRFQARARATSHALLSAYAAADRSPGQGPLAEGVRTPPGPSPARATRESGIAGADRRRLRRIDHAVAEHRKGRTVLNFLAPGQTWAETGRWKPVDQDQVGSRPAVYDSQ